MLSLLPQLIVSGAIMGSVYGLVAVGLGLIWGVMDVINFAHGEFLMLSMYSAYWMHSLFRIDPLFSWPIETAIIFLLGYLTYKVIIKRVVDAPGLTALLATFGWSLVLRNMAQFLWSANYRYLPETILSNKRLLIGPLVIGLPQLAAAIGSILMTLAVFYFLSRTRMGRAIQATSLDRDAAQLMGIDADRVYAFTFGLGGACVGVAGALLSTFFPVYPESGALYSTLAFVIVALGGFGNIRGALQAGVIMGLAEALGGFYLGTQFKYTVVFLIYLLVMQVRPKGLFGW